MSKVAKARFRKHYKDLQKLQKAKAKLRKRILRSAPPGLIKTITDCAHNVLKGNVPLSSKQISVLRRHRKKLERLANPKLKSKRRYLIQNGGVLPALLGPLLTVGSTLLSGLLR